MKIGVISDTHIPKRCKFIPKFVLNAFEDVELILHAGDMLELNILDELAKIAPVKAVYGNNDPDEVKKYLSKRLIIDINNFKIGMVHGDGKGKTTKERALNQFEERLDCIIFGHSHIPYNQVENGILLFNPGSPTDRRRQKSYSIGIIEIGCCIQGQIYYFNDRN